MDGVSGCSCSVQWNVHRLFQRGERGELLALSNTYECVDVAALEALELHNMRRDHFVVVCVFVTC